MRMILSPHAPRWRTWTRAQTLWLAGVVAALAFVPMRAAPRIDARNDARDLRPPGSMLLYGDAIDLAAATAEDFAALPGIGPAKSRRLVNARDEAGGFCGLEEVRRAAGVPAKTWARIVPLVRLRPAPRCRASSSPG